MKPRDRSSIFENLELSADVGVWCNVIEDKILKTILFKLNLHNVSLCFIEVLEMDILSRLL